MREVSAGVREQAGEGHRAAQSSTSRRSAPTPRRCITGAPFDAGADSTILADFKKKVGKLDAPADVKARLIADARGGADRPVPARLRHLLRRARRDRAEGEGQ